MYMQHDHIHKSSVCAKADEIQQLKTALVLEVLFVLMSPMIFERTWAMKDTQKVPHLQE